MKLLVTGAAGFIGSVVTEALVERGDHVVAVDDLRHGHRDAVHPGARFVQLDLLDRAAVDALFRTSDFGGVIHLAAEALIDESLRDPGRFFRVNVVGSLNVLDAMVATSVPRLVFSSTAAVYGAPSSLPIRESDPCRPVNSYGESKLGFERALDWYRAAHGLHVTSLRYFNAAGATTRFGEYHVPETHLIPILFEVALEQRPAIRIFGRDWPTADGTCVRDYIHVTDIAAAHTLALDHAGEPAVRAYNLGNGHGYSNLEVVQAVREVTGRPLTVVDAPRRPGDPPQLVASAERITADLGWKPQYPDLRTIVETAWTWRRRNPRGYSR
jgi:UDP-glucose 4-epimerase